MSQSQQPEMSAILESEPGRSPLKGKPSRPSGQSFDESVDRRATEEFVPYVLFAIAFIAMAATEWWASIRHLPRQPWLYSGMAVVAVGATAFKFRQLRSRLRRLKKGRDGERVVGEFLEKLRGSVAAEVFHDIPGDGFNVDHVVLCRKGIFAIETRTQGKPEGRDAQVTLTKKGVLVDGRAPERDPIRQAQAGAHWISQLLEETTGKAFAVRGVVLYPGWFVAPMDTVWRCDSRQPWVLEPKALPAFIKREPVRLSASDVKLAAYNLGRYVRVVEPSDRQ